ncbi:hypothetical protein [Flavobacterium eburneipallidum]|uniref:hypothetical protein n=1 Tax=Flavobacterium eburneipallidum TaxID=3003263 RepID=UPI0022AC68D4|nr:hypothetical protein [Flavobacterium eburneipallidum]
MQNFNAWFAFVFVDSTFIDGFLKVTFFVDGLLHPNRDVEIIRSIVRMNFIVAY